MNCLSVSEPNARSRTARTCTDSWSQIVFQSRPFLVTSGRAIWDSADRAPDLKKSNSWSRKVRPENGPNLAPFSSKVLLKCGRKVATLFGSGIHKKIDPGFKKKRPGGPKNSARKTADPKDIQALTNLRTRSDHVMSHVVYATAFFSDLQDADSSRHPSWSRLLRHSVTCRMQKQAYVQWLLHGRFLVLL